MARGLDVRTGSITDPIEMDALLESVDFVAVMLGDRAAQRCDRINTDFMVRLVPAMRRQGVRRLLYQAGGLSRPPDASLSPVLWVLRHTLARSYNGQHEDNEAVMAYLAAEARDLNWVVHRAGIGSDGPSQGVLQRSDKRFSVATFLDCATYNYTTLLDGSVRHSCSLSRYAGDPERT